jgi:predicted dehydrogenase
MVVEDSAEGLIKYENGAVMSFYAMNNYLCNEPIEIRVLCEKGRAILSYDDVTVLYHDGTVEREKNHPQKIVSYTSGKDYWGTQHAAQIHQFYKAVAGIEPLEISGREALKLQKIICDIYNNNDVKREDLKRC